MFVASDIYSKLYAQKQRCKGTNLFLNKKAALLCYKTYFTYVYTQPTVYQLISFIKHLRTKFRNISNIAKLKPRVWDKY